VSLPIRGAARHYHYYSFGGTFVPVAVAVEAMMLFVAVETAAIITRTTAAAIAIAATLGMVCG
jgi:hypothetical protein